MWGVAQNIHKLDIILTTRTLQYDVIQRFGKPSIYFKKSLKTELNISWIDLSEVSVKLNIGTIGSADQDLMSKSRRMLQKEGVLAANWESASIAKVCELNKVKCLILRGVTDIPPVRKEADVDIQELDYKKNTKIVIKKLLPIVDKFHFYNFFLFEFFLFISLRF